MSGNENKDNPKDFDEESNTEPNPEENLNSVEEDLMRNVYYYDLNAKEQGEEHVERIAARKNKSNFWLLNYDEETNTIVDPVSKTRSLKLTFWSMRKFEEFRDKAKSFSDEDCEVNVITSERMIVENLNDFGIGTMFDRAEKLAEEFNRIMKIKARDNANKIAEICSTVTNNIPLETISDEPDVLVKSEPGDSSPIRTATNDNETSHENIETVKSEPEELSTNSNEDPINETDKTIKSESEDSINASIEAVFGSKEMLTYFNDEPGEIVVTVKSEITEKYENSDEDYINESSDTEISENSDEEDDEKNVTLKSESNDISTKLDEESFYESNTVVKSEFKEILVKSEFDDAEVFQSENGINCKIKAEMTTNTNEITCENSAYFKFKSENRSLDEELDENMFVIPEPEYELTEQPSSKLTQTNKMSNGTGNSLPAKTESNRETSEWKTTKQENEPKNTNKRKNAGNDSYEDKKDVKKVCVVKPYNYNSPPSEEQPNFTQCIGHSAYIMNIAYSQETPRVIDSELNNDTEDDNIIGYPDYYTGQQIVELLNTDNLEIDELEPSLTSDIEELSVVDFENVVELQQDREIYHFNEEEIFNYVSVNECIDRVSEASSCSITVLDPLASDSNEVLNESDISMNTSNDDSFSGYEADDEARISRRRRQIQIQRDLSLIQRRNEAAQQRVVDNEYNNYNFCFHVIDDIQNNHNGDENRDSTRGDSN